MTSLINLVSPKVQFHIESVAKAISVFALVFLAMRWARRSDIDYDSTLVAFAAFLAVLVGR
tara:strand:+ start:259 stop:441 length:183 start_codon:yes stop_codon:yes gene_type:complete